MNKIKYSNIIQYLIIQMFKIIYSENYLITVFKYYKETKEKGNLQKVTNYININIMINKN